MTKNKNKVKKPTNKKGDLKRPRKNRVYLICFLLAVSSLTIFNLSLYFSNNRKVPHEAFAEVVYDTSYWEQLLSEHPDYFPGWIELAKLEYANGRPEQAYNSLINAKKINPNSQDLKTLEYIISLKDK